MNRADYPIGLKPKDVAKMLQVSVPKIYDIIRRPDFPSIRDGNRIIIPRDAFFNWLDTAWKIAQ